jgi:uncharacterized protein
LIFLIHFPRFSDIILSKGTHLRLPRELIKHIADSITHALENKGMVNYAAPKITIAAVIADVITKNMMAEDKLNEEVKKLLAEHESEISKGQMDYRKVFELTKQKLAKERGVVL